ncbi:Endonuclease/exonuclease/phosphatase [Trinorchestia longiramus]|nr:Endonuclease/exonuclease/phosphatase [Trinorchestia longiramus]
MQRPALKDRSLTAGKISSQIEGDTNVSRQTVSRRSHEIEISIYGKGHVKSQKKGGGVGLTVKNALNWKLEEICVGNELRSEDTLVMKCEKLQANECIILVVCYMTPQGPLAQEENIKKHTIQERVVQKFSRFPVIVMGDMNGHVGLLGEKVNENERKLIDFYQGNGFENWNVTVGNGLHTWENKEWEAAIDYVLVNR